MQGSIEAHQGQQCQQNCAETTSTVVPQSAPEGTLYVKKYTRKRNNTDIFFPQYIHLSHVQILHPNMVCTFCSLVAIVLKFVITFSYCFS